MDEDNYNLLYRENQVYNNWVREQKNRILSMTNAVKKQIEWSKLFTPFISDDSYLTGNIF